MEKQLNHTHCNNKTTLFCVATQQVVALSYRRPIGSKNVGNNLTLLANNPKEHTSHLLRGGSLKSRILILTFFLFQISLYLGVCVISTHIKLDIKFYNRRTAKS